MRRLEPNWQGSHCYNPGLRSWESQLQWWKCGWTEQGRDFPGLGSLTSLLEAIWKCCHKFPSASAPLASPPPLKVHLLLTFVNSSEGTVAAWNGTDTTLNHRLHAPAQLLAYFRGSLEHCITVFEQLGGRWMTWSQSGSCWDCVCFSSVGARFSWCYLIP